MARETLTSREHHYGDPSTQNQMTDRYRISILSPIFSRLTTLPDITKKEGGSSLTLKKWAMLSPPSPTTPKMPGRTPSKSDQPINQRPGKYLYTQPQTTFPSYHTFRLKLQKQRS